jgi:hypothetical protein
LITKDRTFFDNDFSEDISANRCPKKTEIVSRFSLGLVYFELFSHNLIAVNVPKMLRFDLGLIQDSHLVTRHKGIMSESKVSDLRLNSRPVHPILLNSNNLHFLCQRFKPDPAFLSIHINGIE